MKKEIKTKTLKNTELVEKTNFFNELVCNSMTLQELRFFSIYMAKINARDESSRVVTFTLRDFRKIMELKAVYPYYIKDVFNRLLCKVVTIGNNKKGFSCFQIFKKCELIQNQEDCEWYIKIDAHDDALPLMFNLQNRYFKYQLWNALQLKSLNQLRMYEILKQYEKIGKRTIDISDLRNWLGIGQKEYLRWNNFKTRVLDSCQEALLEYTDIGYTYNVIKKGKGGKITAVEFIIYKNENFKDQLQLNKFIENQPEEDYTAIQREPNYVRYLSELGKLLGLSDLDIAYLDVIYNDVRKVDFPVDKYFYEDDYKIANIAESPFFLFLQDTIKNFFDSTKKKSISEKDFNLFFSFMQNRLRGLNRDYSAYLPQKSNKTSTSDDVLEGQLSIDDFYNKTKNDTEENNENLKEQQYLTDDISFLSSAMNDEFTEVEVIALNQLLCTVDLPPHKNGYIFARYHYLNCLYTDFVATTQKTTVNNRYKYFYRMVQNDIENK